MKRQFVKTKIHRATVTDANLNYTGSITIDADLMKSAGILPFEFVHINNVSNAVHWETYAIPGKKGEITLNGPPARLFQKGDQVIILCFSFLEEKEIDSFTHTDLFVDNTNSLVNTKVSYSKFS